MSFPIRSYLTRCVRRYLLIGSLIGLIGVAESTTAQSATLSAETSKIDTLGVYHNNIFLLNLTNKSKFADISVDFSAHPGLPIVGDWTGIGFDTVGTLNVHSGQFTLCTFNDTKECADSANLIQFSYASPDNVPVTGRWSSQTTHDGIGTFDMVNGLFFLRNELSTGNPDFIMVYGIPGDQAIVGDWTGQGIDTPGLFRSKQAVFLLSNQMTNGQINTDLTFPFGLGNYPYVPLTGNWTGTAAHDGIGLYDSGGSTFELKNDLKIGVADSTIAFGNPNDLPIVGHWQLTSPTRP